MDRTPVWGPPEHEIPPLHVYSGQEFDTTGVLQER